MMGNLIRKLPSALMQNTYKMNETQLSFNSALNISSEPSLNGGNSESKYNVQILKIICTVNTDQ